MGLTFVTCNKNAAENGVPGNALIEALKMCDANWGSSLEIDISKALECLLHTPTRLYRRELLNAHK